MADPKPKRPVRRVRRYGAGNAPDPMGLAFEASACGHSGCGGSCNVRYVGPTTHLRDHYAVHAARGVAHVWPAAIVSGLAVLLTGAFVHAAMQPGQPAGADDLREISAQVRSLNTRLDRMEMFLNDAKASADAPPVVPISPPEKQK